MTTITIPDPAPDGTPSLKPWEFLAAVRRHTTGSPNMKATLMALAEYAGFDGVRWSCFPSAATLGEDTEQSAGTVRRHLTEFEARGLIHREPRGVAGGGRQSSTIVFVLGVLLMQDARLPRTSPDQDARLTEARRAPAEGQDARLPTSAPNTEESVELPVNMAPKNGADPRGSRCPEPFLLTSDLCSWARTEGITLDLRDQTRRFVDYWRAQPGAKGRKADWPATWRNWMRRASDDGARRSGPATKSERQAGAMERVLADIKAAER